MLELFPPLACGPALTAAPVLAPTCVQPRAFTRACALATAQGSLVNRLGFRRSVYVGGLISGICVANMPYLGRWLPTTSLTLAAHMAAIGVAQAGTVAMSNNAFAQHQAIKGALNGVVTTFEALAKAVGPATASPLIALALSTHHTQIFYLAIGAFIATSHAMGLLLPAHVDRGTTAAGGSAASVPSVAAVREDAQQRA